VGWAIVKADIKSTGMDISFSSGLSAYADLAGDATITVAGYSALSAGISGGVYVIDANVAAGAKVAPEAGVWSASAYLSETMFYALKGGAKVMVDLPLVDPFYYTLFDLGDQSPAPIDFAYSKPLGANRPF
jgi:hypothetical protein